MGSSPSSSRTAPGLTSETLAPVRIESLPTWPSSQLETAPMPPAGRQLDPVASMRITNSNRREVTVSSRLKKMPPRKGRKNRSMISGLKPSSRSRCRVVVSGRDRRSSSDPSVDLNLCVRHELKPAAPPHQSTAPIPRTERRRR